MRKCTPAFLRSAIKPGRSDTLSTETIPAAGLLALATRHRPTAILANNDYAALIVMSHAQSLGVAVPDALSVVGYDNSYLARTEFIGLTSVDNNYAEMGRLAARQLARRIDNPSATRSVTLLDPILGVTRPSGRGCDRIAGVRAFDIHAPAASAGAPRPRSPRHGATTRSC